MVVLEMSTNTDILSFKSKVVSQLWTVVKYVGGQKCTKFDQSSEDLDIWLSQGFFLRFQE